MVTRPKGDKMIFYLLNRATPSVRCSEQAAVKRAILDALIVLGSAKREAKK